MYRDGRGVPQDYGEAVALFHMAAAQGDARGQENLGWMYVLGRGVPQDYVEAHKWFNLAASLSTGVARMRPELSRDFVADQMTPADLSEAQRRAREWREAHQVP